MMKNLIFVSLAPVFIIALYIYIRDKYEKEPAGRLLLALLAGILIVPAIMVTETYLIRLGEDIKGLLQHLYIGFIVASLSEEGFKYLAFFLFIWRSSHFNEKFDGIVYAVFISLGFAAVENLLYVYRGGGYQVGLMRAFTAVPAHALFGVSMGFHFGLAKFYPANRIRNLVLAFLIPFLWHGFYDFFLMAGTPYLVLLFVIMLVWLWIYGFNRMKVLSDRSVYRMTGLGKRSETNTSGRV
ncbi:MAG: PrsW family intramembrane metalloprotease [Bacteroidetes bacterium]|nr:PrsW family intramembrane metalloprotease [Bacteroidota bacterium]